MKDFSKATPRPWHLKGKVICANIQAGSVSIETPIADVCYTGAERWREEEELNAELIVTAVNNFDKMKDAIETQLQIIEALIGSKRIVNLDESIAYYKQLLDSLK